ncbi:MAG: HAMP domain-containing histidine kinase [Bacteroidaceae bacterium]|nr:HAMP domain-containing histidine kinase [Bacteroidaceae bacterium]
MAYSYYHIRLALYIAAIILDTVVITVMATQATDLLWLSIPIFILVMLVVHTIRLIHYPIRQVKMFLMSIRCNERMIRMPNINDSMLQEMYDNMNEILVKYHENERTIETKKIYYDRILRIITHEIRNTVTPIVTLSDYYISSSAPIEQDDIKEGMTIINNQSKSIKNFLDSYHTLTHLPPPAPSKISIPELFGEMFKLFENEAANVKLTIHYSDIEIYADPSGIRIVLNNLLRNAIESAAAQEEGHVILRATLCENSPQITVTDNGDGIAHNRIEDIFLPFYSTKEHGNGIGLCLSRQIMRLHSGDLLAESYPEKRHTIFTIKFK